jgi:antirestriction protein ArdC
MPSVYEVITNRILKQLEAGTAPWHKPWRLRGRNGLPRNLVTGHEYRGVNVWILLSSGFASPYWLTFGQARQLEGHVMEGQRGSPVVYWKFGKREVQDGDDLIEKPSVLCRYYTVFNVEQCEGLRIRPSDPTKDESQPESIEACERVVTDWQQKPIIRHGGDCASYNKIIDLVEMPERPCFNCAEEYYSTLFHELIHSTGHPSRLNRPSLTEFERYSDSAYSREELVAEMGAAFLAGFCGISNRTINNSAAYVASWLDALKNDSRMILIAASQAQKAADLILQRSLALTT